MNSERDKLQELWRTESSDTGASPAPEIAAELVLHRGRAEGHSQAARLRRRVRLDGWIKIGAILFILAALPLLADRFSTPIWGVLAISLLGVLLGLAQLSWSGRWRETNATLPLAKSLAFDLELWRRRRSSLALLLGATPALAWQVYLLIYLVMTQNRIRPISLVNLLFLTVGGPLIWLLAAWRQRARLDLWLLQIEQALGVFDAQTPLACSLARKRANRRTAILVALFLLLLLAGTMLYWLTH